MQQLKVIIINSTGPLVESWQFFLTGQDLYHDDVDGKFGENTKQATIEFQKKHSLQPDGEVGNKTFGVAMQFGFEGINDKREGIVSAEFPGKPNFAPLTGNMERQKVFGIFTFVADPVPGNKENIRITNNWAKENIVPVTVPQLAGITGKDKIHFHKLAGAQLAKLWKDWQDAGLLHLVLSYAGAYNPRFVRGLAHKGVLSNHAFGSAFDINVPWNGLGALPALVGQKGSVRELVALANQNGFYWGGHFTRRDGMHFEIAKII